MSGKQDHLKDQILVMDAQDGSAKAMKLLVDRWQRRLWHHAYRLTSNPDAAWDVMQETWMAIIKGLVKLQDPAHFQAWAYQITTYKAIDWIKEKTSRRQTSLDIIDERQVPVDIDSGLMEILEQLNPEQRALLSLYYFEELSITEISHILKIPSGTVKSRLHTARQEFKILWERHESN